MTVIEPPKGYTDLHAAYSVPDNQFVNLIGVTVDVMPAPTVAKTGQHMMSFKLMDHRIRDSYNGSTGLQVRFFKADRESLPTVRSQGDVVLLRTIKMSTYSGQRIALASWSTVVLVFPAVSIPEPGFSIAFQGTRRLNCHGVEKDIDSLTLAEQDYVIRLRAELKSTIEQMPDPTTADLTRKRLAPNLPPSAPAEKHARLSASGSKYQMVSELRHRVFADIRAQVVKRFANQYGSCELYVTDYTANNAMWYYTPPEEDTDKERDGDMFGYSGGPAKRTFPGPYGWLVLKVHLKDPHATHVNTKVNEGDFVLLRNVKMKIRATEGAKLEGDMWPDDRNPDRVHVIKLLNHDLPEIREIIDRKNKYWASREKLHPPKRLEDAPRKMTRAERKKEKKEKRQRKRVEERAVAAAARTDGAVDGNPTRGTLNKHIRCSHQDVQTTSLRDILDPDNTRHTNTLPDGRTYPLPFINAKYRARVRVVDYEPKPLEDFAVHPLPADSDVEMSPLDAAYDASSPKLEWFFTLVLEEAGASSSSTITTTTDPEQQRIKVHFQHEDAQYLFGNDIDDPQDLRTNPQLLAKLKEKLFTLWGNLEEKDGDTALSNRPFECCIAEYGVEMDADDPERGQVPFGWKRLYRMFGTTIL